MKLVQDQTNETCQVVLTVYPNCISSPSLKKVSHQLWQIEPLIYAVFFPTFWNLGTKKKIYFQIDLLQHFLSSFFRAIISLGTI